MTARLDDTTFQEAFNLENNSNMVIKNLHLIIIYANVLKSPCVVSFFGDKTKAEK